MKKALVFGLFLLTLFFVFQVKQWSLQEKLVSIAKIRTEFVDPKEKDLKIHLLEQRNQTLESALLQCKQLKSSDAIAYANVIFYPPQNTTFCWIDIGEQNCPIVKKKSVVCFGNLAIGIVERVNKKTSLVRLLSNPQLNVSVRLERGSIQVLTARQSIDLLLQNPAISSKEKLSLHHLMQSLHQKSTQHHLAKGYIQGMQSKFQKRRLLGIGFQYDFADDYGPARNLLTYQPMQTQLKFESPPLLEVGDLLVTTGYDGIFQEGLLVGVLVDFEKENDIAYTVEALPLVDFENLKTVLVLPPLIEDE